MEFVLVATLITALTLGVLQLGIALYVRNVVHDAAVEGAHVAALADSTPAAGVARTEQIIARAVGPSYADDVTAAVSGPADAGTVEITVRTVLPVAGLFGIPRGLEGTGSAPLESFG